MTQPALKRKKSGLSVVPQPWGSIVMGRPLTRYSKRPWLLTLINNQLIDSNAQVFCQPAGNIRARNMMFVSLHLDNGSRRDFRSCRQTLYGKAAPDAPVFQLISQVVFTLHDSPLLRLIRLTDLIVKRFEKIYNNFLFIGLFVLSIFYLCGIIPLTVNESKRLGGRRKR